MKKKIGYLTLISLVLVSVVAFVALRDEEESDIVELNASVKYANKKFTITNEDTVDFVNADLAIDHYFKIRDINLQKGETYTIWQVEFVHHNGMHYPDKGKPAQFSIWCELYYGKNGFYSHKVR